MLKCNGKTFMNLQEAVQWLLNNNALFFICDEDYAADTEISLEDLVNPSPANPKIGSLVLFADGKISPITGITDDSFTVGDSYVELVPGKKVSGFEIDASQHLIVNYLDGTSDDLGPIFSGNVNIVGDFSVTGAINGQTNPSLKPIFCHAISLYSTTGKYRLACLIFTNDGTALTPETFIAWMDNLYTEVGDTIRIPTTGAFFDDNDLNSVAGYMGKTSTAYYFQGVTVSGLLAAQKTFITRDSFKNSILQFNDGVNKIN